MSSVAWWSPEALARSLHLAFVLGLYDAGNDNGQPRSDDDGELTVQPEVGVAREKRVLRVIEGGQS